LGKNNAIAARCRERHLCRLQAECKAARADHAGARMQTMALSAQAIARLGLSCLRHYARIDLAKRTAG
jgi:hypothetical protein